ncbi:hypothetical protein BGX34_005406 [Mortierella sp. NVP85]|nr:hypothetical protein BGX34_005406 [Mortierella sp. NVP85]
MTSLTIRLQDPYLVLRDTREHPSISIPSSASPDTSSASSISSSSSYAASMEQTSPLSSMPPSPAITQRQSSFLKGVLILTISKPIKVASLAVTLNGSSHLALSNTSAVQTVDKRIAHYSRQHFRVQQFLIEPSPDPEQFTTITAPSASSAPIHTDGDPLCDNQIAYPFAIQVPNDVPVSVTTPHGGTIYRLSAELTMAKSRGASSGIKALLSAAGVGSSVVTAVTTVNIFRAGFLRHPPRSTQTPPVVGATTCRSTEGSAALVHRNSELDPLDSCICAAHLVDEHDSNENNDSSDNSDSNDGNSSNDESGLDSDSISHTWPDHLDATVSIPHVHLPPKSQPNLKVRVKLLGAVDVAIKAFQASLYERVVFRVAKTINMEKTGRGKQTSMSIVGIRERPVSTQRMDEGWQQTSGSSVQIEKVCQFATPNTVREPNELYSSRNCNASTFGRISKSARQRLKEDEKDPSVSPSEIEYGAIDIEVQHFLRFSLLLTGPTLSSTDKTVERQLGDIPVVVRGVPGELKCDATGLPSYLDSFSTSIPSLDEERTYEAVTRASLGSHERAGGFSGIEGEPNNYNRDSILSLASLIGLRPSEEDLENDDAFMAIMGLRESRTPPRYEDSIGRPSLDTIGTNSDLPIQSPMSPRTDRAGDSQNINNTGLNKIG